MPKLNKRLLELLACPVDKGRLDYDERYQALCCQTCRRCYQIRDGIPMMLQGSGPALDANDRKGN